MLLRNFLLRFSLVLALLAPLNAALAQRGPAADAWEFLGERTVGFGVDNDTILINQSEDWFRNKAYRSLRFAAERNDVNLISIRVVYINGFTEDLPIDKLVRRGGELVVDLRGERSFIKQIDMRYRSNLGISIGQGGISIQEAAVKVYGERVQRRDESVPVAQPAPIAGADWSLIESKRFNRLDQRVVLTGKGGEGRFAQIKLRARGEPIRVMDITVRFRNGETQSVRIDQQLSDGQETRAIDLEGRQRGIDAVTVNLEARRRPGVATVDLLGLRRSGGGVEEPIADPYAARGWVQLGEKTVGLRVDRDVIEVGQSEEWFRNRAFRRLHLIAQRSEIRMIAVRIVYLNGFTEDIRLDKVIPVGGDLNVDLRGERSYIRQIEMTYRARPSFRGQAIIKVYGEPVRR